MTEAFRVLKKGGKYIFIEHVAAPGEHDSLHDEKVAEVMSQHSMIFYLW